MPSAKDQSMHTRHATAAERAARAEADDSMQSAEMLAEREPSELKDHKVAAKVWRRTVKEFNQLKAHILTKQDYDLMIDYCLSMESLKEIDDIRTSAIETWKFYKDLYKAAVKAHDDVLAKSHADSVINAMKSIKELDARVDAKRKYLLSVRQSLYLTPRSRTGQAPKVKEAEEPKDGLEALFGMRPVFIGKDTKSEQGDEQ